MRFTLNRFRNDIHLLYDFVCSLLKARGFLCGQSVKFWHYRTKEGFVFKLRRGVWDSAIIAEIWWLDEYLRHLEGLDEGAVVIDVGAHLGAFSIYIASKFEKIKVLAFEPDPNNFSLLEENIKANHLEATVFPFKLALVDATRAGSKARFSTHPYNLGMHSLPLLPAGCCDVVKDYSFEVGTTSLEEVFKEHKLSRCDFLKMDCEGCEYVVLPQVSEDVLRRIKNLTLEYHLGGDIQQVKQCLENAGFKTKFDRAIPNRLFGWVVRTPLLSAWRE